MWQRHQKIKKRLRKQKERDHGRCKWSATTCSQQETQTRLTKLWYKGGSNIHTRTEHNITNLCDISSHNGFTDSLVQGKLNCLHDYANFFLIILYVDSSLTNIFCVCPHQQCLIAEWLGPSVTVRIRASSFFFCLCYNVTKA